MARILVRFNTKHREDPHQRRWRVLEDGLERLAHVVRTRVPGETITEAIASGEVKDHLLFHGRVQWDGDIATIQE